MPSESAALAKTESLSTAKLAWLHTPKAGTSFANVLIAWKCPHMLGFMEKEKRAMAHRFCSKHAHDCEVAQSLCSSHTPIMSDEDEYNMTAIHNWNRQQGSFVGMLRKPMQRHMSGFIDNQLMSTFGVDVVHGHYKNPLDYAQANEGCATKLITGLPCSDKYKADIGMVPKAIERLDTGFAFIGLTEEWALSVCLFHTMFGGECSAHEFNNVRPGHAHQKEYDLAQFKGWTDPYDSIVYDHAKSMFWSNVARYDVSWETCRLGVCKEAEKFF